MKRDPRAPVHPSIQLLQPIQRMTTPIQKTSPAMPLRRLAFALASSALIAGCASGGAWSPSDKTIPTPVWAVGHYGKGIGIPRYSLGNFHGGNSTGWGGGGGTVCCVLVPRYPNEPVMVNVKWTTYRSRVDEELQHEATVPIHFATTPGEDSAGLIVHFLPGHKVELWESEYGPASSKYPGPKYPDDPGPRYAPLPGEKPERPVIETKN
jgi:Protein of unknown function (DUF3304)